MSNPVEKLTQGVKELATQAAETSLATMPTVTTVKNWIGGTHIEQEKGKPDRVNVTTPYTGEVIATVPLSTAKEVDSAIKCAQTAFESWSKKTIKARVQCLHTFRHLVQTQYLDELTHLVSLEHGKTLAEAKASVMKGMETVEYAASLPAIVQGRVMQVSTDVTCQDQRVPLGVVASIVPFNFPIMVPMWTLPIAIAMGNTLVVKPSEKVPLAMCRIAQILQEAGLPDGVVNLVHGTADTAINLCDHPGVKAVTFVGTSTVAKAVTERCRAAGKRCLALGGAKNHLVAAPDCDIEMTAQDVVASFTGCCGQRCMAASVLLTIGPQPQLLKSIIKKAEALSPGCGVGQMGPVIDLASKDKITKYIDLAEAEGCKLLLDGRMWLKGGAAEIPNGVDNPGMCKNGFWMGPTIIMHKSAEDAAIREEIFGPVISIYECATLEEAIAIENSNPYGNAACIYTSSGAVAEKATQRFSAGMVGVNIGVPVPREPFSFGGINMSNFGDSDITGEGGINFFSYTKKVTSKWWIPKEKHWLN